MENLTQGAQLDTGVVAALRERYCSAVGLSPRSQVVVATSAASTVVDTGLGWGACRLLFQNGQDGADKALLGVLRDENVTARFTEVVIGSGDHAFALTARYLRTHGVRITVVVATRRSLSNALRREADRVIVLDQSSPDIFGDVA